MAKGGAELVLVVATLVFFLAAGGVDAEDLRTGEQVLTFYIPGPSTIISGPGSASNNISETGFGTLAVFDVPFHEGVDNTSKYFGQSRGLFLVDSYSGTNVLMLFTLDFTSNGSVVISGTYDLGQPRTARTVMPILSGSGEFLYVQGHVLLQPILPEATGTPGEVLAATFYTEMHYTLPRPYADVQAPNEYHK